MNISPAIMQGVFKALGIDPEQFAETWKAFTETVTRFEHKLNVIGKNTETISTYLDTEILAGVRRLEQAHTAQAHDMQRAHDMLSEIEYKTEQILRHLTDAPPVTEGERVLAELASDLSPDELTGRVVDTLLTPAPERMNSNGEANTQ